MTTQTPRDLRDLGLLAVTFVVAVAGLVYELIAGAVASYLLGDSITQFSLVIGLFMTSLGIGAWLSRYVTHATQGFALSQILLGIVGGFSAPLLFLAYGALGQVQMLLFGVVIAIGALSGLEIPLITRVLQKRGAMPHVLSNVLTADYAGALLAAVAFPLLVVPHLGLMRASLVFGLLNLAVAGYALWVFRAELGRGLWVLWLAGLVTCVIGLAGAGRLAKLTDVLFYEDDVILSEQTAHQQVTVTRYRDRTRLFLDGAVQFDSLDEHRYHEALVHPAIARVPDARRVLVLGGGDGMAVREVLRWPNVQEVVLVDLDPRVTQIFRDQPDLSALNSGALRDPRVRIENMDAWVFVDQTNDIFDVVIADLPDPKNYAISKLYTREFYARLVERISQRGVIVTQSGSPVFARDAFWTVVETLRQTRNPVSPGAGLTVQPYHSYVPSFGDWGFVMAGFGPMPRPVSFPKELRYLTADLWPAMVRFGADAGPVTVSANSIQTHALVERYRRGWAAWYD